MSLDELVPPATATIERDRWGRPLIVPPDGGKPVGYGRPSGIAKLLEDGHGLEQWKLRRVALGLVADSSLYAQVAGIGSDDDSDKKKRLNDLAQKAMDAAGASSRRDLGSALHEMCERLDRGEDIRIPDQWAADIAAYRAATAAFEMVGIECFMVCDAIRFAGTPDRIMRMRLPDGRLIIGDIKTGTSVEYSGLPFSMQLGIYSRSLLYDPTTGTRRSAGDIDQSVGVIIHLPVGEGRCRLYEVDLDAGWAAVQTALEVKAWRNRGRKLIVPFSAPGRAVADVPQASPAQASEGLSHPPTAPEPEPARPWDELAQRRLRATEIKAAGHGDELLKLWPQRADGSLPSLLAPGDITPEEWQWIDGALEMVEIAQDLYVDDAERATLKAQHDAMPSDLRAEFAAWYASTGWSGAHRMTRGQADATIEVLHPLCVRAAERRAQVTQHLAMVDATTAEAVIRLCVRPERVETVLADIGQALELEAEAIGCVVDAVAERLLRLVDGALRLPEGTKALDPKGLRDAARPIAERYDLPLPRSAADVVGSPLLAALTWASQ